MCVAEKKTKRLTFLFWFVEQICFQRDLPGASTNQKQ